MRRAGYQLQQRLGFNTQKKRTLAVAATYRVASSVLLAVVTYLITGEFFDSSAITLAFAVVATAVYYVNDRAWERTGWGRSSGR